MQSFAVKNEPTQILNKKLISSETLGSLINLSGRQRILSQRIVLNVILASQVLAPVQY